MVLNAISLNAVIFTKGWMEIGSFGKKNLYLYIFYVCICQRQHQVWVLSAGNSWKAWVEIACSLGKALVIVHFCVCICQRQPHVWALSAGNS